MMQAWQRSVDPARRKRVGAIVTVSGLFVCVVLVLLRNYIPHAVILLGVIVTALGTKLLDPPRGSSTYGIGVLFAEAIPRDVLAQRLQQAGVRIESTRDEYLGWLPTQQSLVHFCDQTWELEILGYDPEHYLEQYQAEVIQKRAQILQFLGKEPQTLLVISLENEQEKVEGELAAMHVICQLARDWPCVVENGDEQILSIDAIRHALENQQPVLAIRDNDYRSVW